MDAKTLIDSIRLPTLSKTLLEIIEVEKANPISFLEDIKKIVERDPLLSAHILKVANSSFYGFSREVRTISHAIGLLGARKIRNMAFSFSIFDFLKKVAYKPDYADVFNRILRKSLLISAISTILAKKIDYLDAEELYVSGLLSEIGSLILFLHNPEKYYKIYSNSDKKLVEEEQKVFATDHLAIGIAFCDKFGLPRFFKTTIENQIKLKNDDEHSKLSFISHQITELLLTEGEKERESIFKEVENNTKKLLHLSLSEIEESITRLPEVMEAFAHEFPEMQTDINKIIEAGSSLIISLMKKEMEMVILTQELGESQKKLAREKMFLSHMLNLSYFFSSLMSPLRIINSLFEYFENFIHEFTIEFIYKSGKGDYRLIKNKGNTNGDSIDINEFMGLQKSKISNETVRLDKDEMERLSKSSDEITLVFPISFHHNFFGFLLLNVEKDSYLEVDVEMSYVQILSNIIANSFQNYFSFEGLKNETNKKKMVTRELLKFDKELHHSKEHLIELQKSEILGGLLPVIFHKLKNKLTPILGYSQILLAKVQEPTIAERIKKIEKNANELSDQLNSLRDYFKTDMVTEEQDNLNSIIRRLKSYFGTIESNRNIAVKLDLDRSIPNDILNSGQLESLVANVVDNAVTAIRMSRDSGGVITVTTKNDPPGNGYSLIITDNGIGIKEESIARIWLPFFSEFPEKTGIGLTVCEKVIENHQASCQVNSIVGESTEFRFDFKRKLEDEPVEVPLLQKSDVHGKILIVDDEAFLLDLMKDILETEGHFNIITTTSGKEAIEMIDESFDLVISDIRMPEVSGMDVYAHLKSKNMESKALMVTADPYSEDVAEFLQANSIQFMRKPFELLKFKQQVLEKLS
ncbi:MAG: HDOD domain-containing protein [bacterium]|nr:HDOD domain-containing protein [bacterium]